MKTIIGVNFRRQGKIYYFDPNGLDIRRGDHIIVETAQGPEYASVVMPPHDVEDEKITAELKPVIRIATEDDDDQIALNQKNEVDAIRICKQKVAAHELEMKLIRAEYAFDRSKLTFFFTADGRVDFRELVKDLASVFRTRIELRQVGVRDETKLLGGIGVCGRELCCATWLPDFVPVSIKMAKEQNLSLNSAKISGVCGRLMCCLKNEAETYEYLNAQLPNVNATVKTPEGYIGTVKSTNVLLQTVTVILQEDKDEKELREYRVDELKFTPGRKKKDADDKADEAEAEILTADGTEKPENTEGGEKRENRKNDRGNRRNGENGEGRVNRESRENGEGHREHGDRRENGEGRRNGDRRENSEGRRNGERRENGEGRENRERRENGERRNNENRGNREGRDNREWRENGERRNNENRGNRDRRDYGEGRDNREWRENRDRRRNGDKRSEHPENGEARENPKPENAEIKESVKSEIKKNVKPEIKENVKPEIKENVKTETTAE